MARITHRQLLTGQPSQRNRPHSLPSPSHAFSKETTPLERAHCAAHSHCRGSSWCASVSLACSNCSPSLCHFYCLSISLCLSLLLCDVSQSFQMSIRGAFNVHSAVCFCGFFNFNDASAGHTPPPPPAAHVPLQLEKM